MCVCVHAHAGKGGDRTNMYGYAKGTQKEFGMHWDEYIKDMDIKAGSK